MNKNSSKTMFRAGLFAASALLAAFLSTAAPAAEAVARSIKLASTTSTDNSGLFGHLLPIFESASGIKVHVIAVGTGQALRLARNGDADVLLVHHAPSEKRFVAEGFGVARFDVMYNDFVIVGPAADPARLRGLTDAPAALTRIAGVRALFASRGDDSGTHKAELGLWRAAAVDAAAASGDWYRETGSGMGATLNTAAGLGAYALTDRATWIGFKNKANLVILVEGDKRLFNQYGVIRIDPARHPHVKAREGQSFIDWLVSPAGQNAIAAYRLDGQQLFYPNARGSGS